MTTLAPHVRSEFAKRLKIIRTQRGFNRARYFASRLGIEENRYTRYERAEVEPSLTLIHKMCETLGITPNELLGFEPTSTIAGFSDPSVEGGAKGAGEGGARDKAGALAWSLASEIVAVRQEGQSGRKGAGDPLESVRETGIVYRQLLSEPFETIAKLADDVALKSAPAKRRSEVAGLMSSFTDALRR